MADQTPTLAGFTTFCRDVAGITSDVMPDADPGFATALQFATSWTPCELACLDCYLFTAAIYNLGVSLLIEYQQDQPGQVFFTNLRASFKTNNFVAGVVSSAADESTSTTLTVGDQLANLSAFDMAQVTNPFGRQWVNIVGAMGPSAWGLN